MMLVGALIVAGEAESIGIDATDFSVCVLRHPLVTRSVIVINNIAYFVLLVNRISAYEKLSIHHFELLVDLILSDKSVIQGCGRGECHLVIDSTIFLDVSSL